jgi:hypothetical protein
MAQNLALAFTLVCVNGHRLQVDETEGQRLNGTACQCGKPMFVSRLTITGVAIPAPFQRCPVHSDGDPLCWRMRPPRCSTRIWRRFTGSGWNRDLPDPVVVA